MKSSTFPKEEVYGLLSQIKRASTSICANIAEGHSRHSTKDFIRFLRISRGSLAELESHLEIAYRLKFISAELLGDLIKRTAEIGIMLAALIRSLDDKTKKG